MTHNVADANIAQDLDGETKLWRLKSQRALTGKAVAADISPEGETNSNGAGNVETVNRLLLRESSELDQTRPGLRHHDDKTPPLSQSNGATSIVIPPPYLPLRKQASQTLRSRVSQVPRIQEDDRQETLIGMMQKLRPDTTRWSRDSNLDHDLMFSESNDHTISGSKVIDRPNTASTPGADGVDSLPSLARSSTSTSDPIGSDLSLANEGNTLCISGKPYPSPRRSTLYVKGSPTFWRDGGARSIRESIMTSFTEGTTVVSDTSGNDIWTPRSSQAKYESQASDWQRISDDEFSVEDYITMYAEMPDGPRDYRSGKKEDIPPVPQITIPTPPLQRDSDATSQLSSPPPLSETNVSPTIGRTARQLVGDSITTASSDGMRISLKSPETISTSPVTPISPDNPVTQDAQTSQRRIRVPRDFYGFKQESQYVTQNQYNAWYKDYKIHLARRKKKWTFLMNTHGIPSDTFPERFPPRSSEVKRYIRKGIPPEWRGAAWFFYGDGAAFLDANPGLYHRLVKQAASGQVGDQYVDIIERDLHRTFPDNVEFKPDAPPIADPNADPRRETGMIKSLRRVLQAYAVHHPKVGYCQSLNFLAGHLLLFMRLSFRSSNYEERAFALLCILTEKYLPGTHSIILEGCDVDIGVLMTILQETMPAVWAKLDDYHPAGSTGRKLSTRSSVTLHSTPDALPDVSLATTAWFMSCFVSTLPIESTCRVWDCIWYEGSKTIFRVALAIFKLGEKAIRKAADGSEVFQIVQTLPKGLLDANELLNVATMKTGKGVMERLGNGTPGFGGLSQKTVETRRDERRRFAKASKERKAAEESMPGSTEAHSLPSSPLPTQEGTAGMPGGGLKRSRTRGTLKRLKSMRKVAAQ